MNVSHRCTDDFSAMHCVDGSADYADRFKITYLSGRKFIIILSCKEVLLKDGNSWVIIL